jgi:hypothetical protein
MRKGISVLLIFAVLAGFGGVAGAADSETTNPPPADAKRILKLRKQALKISPQESVAIQLSTQEKIEGILVGVSDEGITLALAWNGSGPPQNKPRTIRFEEMKGMSAHRRREAPAAFRYGFTMGIFLGPLGAFAAWLLATGRAED